MQWLPLKKLQPFESEGKLTKTCLKDKVKKKKKMEPAMKNL